MPRLPWKTLRLQWTVKWQYHYNNGERKITPRLLTSLPELSKKTTRTLHEMYTSHLISINNIVEHLGKDMALALPGLHALTGCDYTQAFLNKGKIKPFNLVMKNKKFQECMRALIEHEVNQTNIEQCEAFICN